MRHSDDPEEPYKKNAKSKWIISVAQYRTNWGFVFRGHESWDLYSAFADDHVENTDPVRTGLSWPRASGVFPELLGVVRRARRFEHFRVVLSLRRRFFLELIFAAEHALSSAGRSVPAGRHADLRTQLGHKTRCLESETCGNREN